MIVIWLQNANAIVDSEEVHIFYIPKSQGIHFDLGMTFMLNILYNKRIKIIQNDAAWTDNAGTLHTMDVIRKIGGMSICDMEEHRTPARGDF